MSRRIDDLSKSMRPLAVELLARCVEAGIDIKIIDTLRTEEEHEDNVRRGVSWASKSKHLTGDAIDIAPKTLLAEKGWAPASPLWEQLGKIGESLGLIWGGRWKVKDMCHFELKTS